MLGSRYGHRRIGSPGAGYRRARPPRAGATMTRGGSRVLRDFIIRSGAGNSGTIALAVVPPGRNGVSGWR
eukprot:759356-Hanusia_phi.AAC.1